MFGEIIRLVEDSFFPIDVELLLADSVTDPVKTHVDSFGAFLFDSVVGDAGGSAVVGLERGRWLGMAEFFEVDANGAGFFAVVEEGSEFGFGRTGEDFTHDLAENVDGAVRRWRWSGRIRWLVRVWRGAA